MTSRFFPFAVAALALAGAAPSQSWALNFTVPSPPPFSTASVGNDTTGAVLVDESTPNTFLLGATGWTLSATNLNHTLLGTTVSDGPNVFRFGGIGAIGFSNALDRFDRATASWVPVPPTVGSTPPSARILARGATVNNGTSILFGGNDGVNMLAETWQMVDVGGLASWTLQTTPTGLTGRTGHSMARGPGGTAVLFGGNAGAGALGDTWIFGTGSWTQFTGTPSPAPAIDAAMTYDPVRDMTVLVHPNGETWEWNGFVWRLVGATGVTPQPGAQIAFDAASGAMHALHFDPTAAQSQDLIYTPSPASYTVTLQNFGCPSASGTGPRFRMDPFQRSLPFLGTSLHTRLTNATTSGALFGAFEFSTMFSVQYGTCGCQLGLLLNGASQFIPNIGGSGDWFLPIANNPALLGVALDMQAFLFDSSMPCAGERSTQRATIVIG